MPAYRREEPPATPPSRTIRLDWNESGYGPSPKALAALRDLRDLHRYPEIDAHTLRHALGVYIGAPGDQVIAGAGLDDVLNTLAMLLLEPGDRVVISEPTFGVYRPLFSSHGAEVCDAPLIADWNLDIDAVLDAAECAKLIVVCNPNNPTGNLFDPDAVERICAEANCVVAIDEAYAEFAGVNHLPLMDRYPNVAVLRTMSKFAGLAGMRVGYGVFPPALMEYLLRVMPAFCNVSAAATATVLASLEDLDYLNDIVARIISDREALIARLRAIPGVTPMNSATNFVLVRLPLADAGPVVRELATRGVFVRSFGRPDLRPYLRVSVGSPEENAIFVDELQSILEGSAG
ncbi:MAG: histidinol-phosphate transaminase [Thermomicrobiales bacterium]|nr:histidinol-phosphate transaminase [Thermomicrobiales bacterium]